MKNVTFLCQILRVFVVGRRPDASSRSVGGVRGDTSRRAAITPNITRVQAERRRGSGGGRRLDLAATGLRPARRSTARSPSDATVRRSRDPPTAPGVTVRRPRLADVRRLCREQDHIRPAGRRRRPRPVGGRRQPRRHFSQEIAAFYIGTRQVAATVSGGTLDLTSTDQPRRNGDSRRLGRRRRR